MTTTPDWNQELAPFRRSDTTRSLFELVLTLGALGLLSVPIPAGVDGRGTAPLFRLFWEGLNGFYDSIYYVLQCSVP